jgi:hypothetical protein
MIIMPLLNFTHLSFALRTKKLRQAVPMTMNIIQTEKAEVVKYLVQTMRYYKDKKEMLIISYNTGSHWVLLTISMRHNQVWYCDSNRPTDLATGKRGTHDYSEVMGVLNE